MGLLAGVGHIASDSGHKTGYTEVIGSASITPGFPATRPEPPFLAGLLKNLRRVGLNDWVAKREVKGSALLAAFARKVHEVARRGRG